MNPFLLPPWASSIFACLCYTYFNLPLLLCPGPCEELSSLSCGTALILKLHHCWLGLFCILYLFSVNSPALVVPPPPYDPPRSHPTPPPPLRPLLNQLPKSITDLWPVGGRNVRILII